MSISVRVKELMRKKGISAYNLSNYTGISQATLSRILNKDTKPNASNLKSLAEYFQVEQEWLLSGNEDVENYSTCYLLVRFI
jgi:transcriptional regulator with XRE-family HTH domain